ncbi:hypothetical protein BJ878DRAFT_545866 [Calycina marina]|uniref:Uncharacterized protein n=1 Tax=Calycina marina TaxID=1763456 RepID=A0A9P8CD08_9HELO|nr:hypothetical protein BJ878DRAFT_545866 [Calycina marina]
MNNNTETGPWTSIELQQLPSARVQNRSSSMGVERGAEHDLEAQADNSAGENRPAVTGTSTTWYTRRLQTLRLVKDEPLIASGMIRLRWQGVSGREYYYDIKLEDDVSSNAEIATQQTIGRNSSLAGPGAPAWIVLCTTANRGELLISHEPQGAMTELQFFASLQKAYCKRRPGWMMFFAHRAFKQIRNSHFRLTSENKGYRTSWELPPFESIDGSRWLFNGSTNRRHAGMGLLNAMWKSEIPIIPQDDSESSLYYENRHGIRSLLNPNKTSGPQRYITCNDRVFGSLIKRVGFPLELRDTWPDHPHGWGFEVEERLHFNWTFYFLTVVVFVLLAVKAFLVRDECRGWLCANMLWLPVIWILIALAHMLVTRSLWKRNAPRAV